MNNGEIKIDVGIPIPAAVRKTPIYPVESMNVGESFLIPEGTCKNPPQVAATSNYRFRPKRFTSRKVEGGTRIWRIE